MVPKKNFWFWPPLTPFLQGGREKLEGGQEKLEGGREKLEGGWEKLEGGREKLEGCWEISKLRKNGLKGVKIEKSFKVPYTTQLHI